MDLKQSMVNFGLFIIASLEQKSVGERRLGVSLI